MYEIKECYKKHYTTREIDLNKQLLDECAESHPNFARIEDLLQQGADPLGVTMSISTFSLTPIRDAR